MDDTDFKELWIEYIPLPQLVKMERNPKLHSPKIRDSFARYGFVDPVLIDEGTGKLVAGHGRLEDLEKLYEEGKPPPERIKVDSTGEWRLPVVRGVTFKSEGEAEEYGITANALTIAGGFDEAELERIIEETKMDPLGLEVELEKEIDTMIEVIEDLKLEDVIDEADIENAIVPNTDDKLHPNDDEAVSDQTPVIHENREKKLSDQQIYDQLPFQEGGLLNKVIQLSEEAYFPPEDDDFKDQCINVLLGKELDQNSIVFAKTNLEIPNLRPDMLVEELPPNLQTWGDRLSTPDDGKAWWFYNYGAVPHRDLPLERTIFSFFTHDEHIETWWATPAYRVGQILVAGVKNIVVPDFSMWDNAPTVLHYRALYRAAWMGRYFQEAGLRIIPRLEYFQEKSKEVALNGIPKNSPIVATQFQTDFDEDEAEAIFGRLREALHILRPGLLLVYASAKGRSFIGRYQKQILNETGGLTILRSSSEVRKKEIRKKETNPALLELRKQRRGRGATRETTPDK